MKTFPQVFADGNSSKFSSVFVIFLISMLLMAGGASATVTSVIITDPNGDENWAGTKSITWTSNCDSGEYVKLYLYKDSTQTQKAIDNTCTIECTPKVYTWGTTSESDGDDYKIKIVSCSDDEIYDYSDGFFTIDNSAPTTTEGESGTKIGEWYITDVTVTLSCSDTGPAGCDETYYTIDGGAQQTYSPPFTISDDGTHTLAYWSVDNAGNEESQKTATIKIDKTPPTTTITVGTPKHGTNPVYVSSSTQFTLGASDDDSGVQSTEYKIDSGGSWTNYDPFTVSGEGSHTVYYRSTDNAGNVETENSNSLSIYVDDSGPSVTNLAIVLSYVDGTTYVSGTSTITADVSDSGSDVDYCEYTLGGSTWLSASYDSDTCTASSVDTSSASSINMKATDNLGNVGTDTAVPVTPDTTPPTTTDNSDAVWHDSDQNIILSPTDSGSGVAHTYYCIYNYGESACNPTIEGTSVSVECSADSVCEKIVRYYSTDNVDNEETEKESDVVKIDKQNPSAIVTGAPDNWYVTKSGVGASVDCGDSSGSGCDEGTYKLKVYTEDPTTCPSEYSSYDLTPPQTITERSWVCAAVKDVAGNVGYTATPVDFKVYPTISGAIADANSGDTVEVAAGTYSEDVLIDKSLNLIGETGGSKPVITGASNNFIVKVTGAGASNVVIDNFEVNGGGSGTGDNNFDYGILIQDSDNAEIMNSVVKNIWKVSSNGIGVEGSINTDIHDNVISSFHKRGIIYINSDGIFYDNEIIGDNVDGTNRVQNLVNLWGGSTIEVYNNKLHNALTTSGVTPTWDSPGIFVSSYGGSGDSYANIHDNKIYDCDSGIVIGSVYATADGSSVDITNNNLHDLERAITFEVERKNGGMNIVSAVITGNTFTNNQYDFYHAINIEGTNNYYGGIQQTIDTASLGDTINVAAGTYVEDLTITTDNLELVGSGAIIKGVLNVPITSWPLAVPNIDVQAEGVKIHGFTIEGPDYVADYYASGIVLDGQNIEIYDTNFVTTSAENTDELAHAITTYSKTAIPTADVSGLYIHDNTFTGSGLVGTEAIYINPHTGIGTITIDNNEFSGAIFIGVTAESGNVEVTDNEIDSNVIGKGLYGIRFMDSTYAGNYDNILISENTVHNFQRGIRVGNGGDGDSVFVASILSNTLSNNDFGIWTRKGSDVTATNNLISGNIVGIQNDIATIVNAENNWWGHITGPYHPTLNLWGQGNAVSDNVNFEQWSINEQHATDLITPSINSVELDKSIVQGGVTIHVTVDVSDENGIVAVKADDKDWDCTNTGGNVWKCSIAAESGEGVHYVEVWARDIAGNEAIDNSQSYEVDNTAPTANANGPYPGNEGSSINFDGTASSDNYGIASYEWDLDNDGYYDDATGVSPQFTWNDDYSSIIGLKVTDLTGKTDTYSTTVTVDNVAPVVEAGTDQATNEGTSIYLAATFTDDGILDTHTAEIDWGDGTTDAGVLIEVDGSGTVSGSHTYVDNGVYTVTVTVTDDDGASTPDTLTVTVNDVSPTANAGQDQDDVDEGDAVIFDGSGSIAGSSCDPISLYTWDFGDGSSESGDSLTAPTHVYVDDGTYTVTLIVADEDNSDSDTMTVTVNDVSPTANAGQDQDDVDEGDAVIFDGSGSIAGSSCDPISLYTWDFGDGSSESGDSLTAPTHVYVDDGTYTVTLIVADEDNSDSDTMTVTINNVPPTVTVTSPNGEEIWKETQEITWTATEDPDVDDIITIDIYYSSDGGENWNLISSEEENDGTYSWDTVTVLDGANYLIKVIATDDEGGASDDISDGVFIIDNSPPEITASSFSAEVGEPIIITPTITDGNDVITATLYYSIGGEAQTPVTKSSSPWEWDIGSQSSHTTITYYIEAEDEAGNAETSPIYTVTVYDFILSLENGWNQVSVPKQPDADSIVRILASGGVFQYDAVSDTWIHGDNLTSINLGIGYFIESGEEQSIGINYQDHGSVPPSVTEAGLEPGWNLVGYMCTQSGNAYNVIPPQLLAEISVVYWYDNTGVPTYYDLIYPSDAGTMEPGKGYWMHIPKFYSGEELSYINICAS